MNISECKIMSIHQILKSIVNKGTKLTLNTISLLTWPGKFSFPQLNNK